MDGNTDIPGTKVLGAFLELGKADLYVPSVLSPALRMAFLLLLLICATWLLGLMAVNSDVMTFHYLFAVFSCLQVTLRLCLCVSIYVFLPLSPPCFIIRLFYFLHRGSSSSSST